MMGKRKPWGVSQCLTGVSCYQESTVVVDEEKEEVVSALGHELLIEKEIRFRDLKF